MGGTSDAISPMTDLRKRNGHENPWRLRYFGPRPGFRAGPGAGRGGAVVLSSHTDALTSVTF